MVNGGEYLYIVAEIFDAPHEKSRHKIRARPLPGQWASPEYRIECSLDIRQLHNIGQFYKFKAKFKNTNTAPQLYASHYLQPELITSEAASAFIAAAQWQ
jgi:hypothetical protein